MIAIVNTIDITGMELNEDWTILEYDTNDVDGSSLAAILYDTLPPECAIQLLSQDEFEHFKTTNIWRAK